jgi:hypothetical protein
MNEVEAITWRTGAVSLFPVARYSLVEINPGVH